jgi:tetratricopeptide (TPR) repeat protein
VTSTDTSVLRTPGERARRVRPGPAPAFAALVIALAVGLGFGRFVTYHSGAGAQTVAPTPPTPTGQSLTATISNLEAAAQHDPTNVGTWQQLGSAYIRRAVQDPTFYDLAQKAFDKADALAPNQEATLIGRGALALSRHQFADALVIARRTLAVQPLDPDALVVKTDADVELGNYADANADLQTLITHRPALAVYARISYLEELHGEYDAAIASMREARVAGSDSPLDTADVTNFLGDLEFGRGDPQTALTEYDEALTLSPMHPLATVGKARALAALGRIAAAITTLQQLIADVPLPQATELLGDLETMKGDRGAAADAYGLVRAVTKLQQSSGVVVDLELARFEADHAAGVTGARYALQLAEAAYRERPGNVYAADVLEWTRFRSGDIAGARALVDLALRLGTRDAVLHYHAAAVLQASGDDTRARAELAHAFHQNPWFTFFLRGEATALAHRLGVAVPAAWAR